MDGIECTPHDWTEWAAVLPLIGDAYHLRYCRLCGKRQTQSHAARVARRRR
jgi:hypothetical protein